MGTGDDEIITSVTVYLNPAVSIVNIEANSIVKSVRIYSVDGTMLKQLGQQKNGTRLDVSGLKQGTYFMRIETENGMVTRKLIKY